MRIQNFIKGQFIAGGFLLLILTAGFFMSAVTIWQTKDHIDGTEPESMLSGKWASAYEDIYNKNLQSFEISKNLWGAFNYITFNEGMPGVVISKENWLFTSEEFEKQKGHRKNLENNIAYVKDVRDYLAQRHTELLVVPVPAKARLYQDKLSPYKYPAYKANIYAVFIKAMETSGIQTVDTLSQMENYRFSSEKREPVFLKTDTHWSPAGARITAAAIAEYLQENPFEGYEAEKRYISRVKDRKEKFKGDLTRYVPVGGMSHMGISAPSEKLTLYQTAAYQSETKADMSAALFAEETPNITLVGTSYSANENWNFDGFLKEALETDILNAADEGLGPFKTMQEYLNDQAFKTAPPKLVIWEIPERYLTFEYDLESNFHTDTGA